MVGGRPKPSPCLKLFSFLYPKTNLPALVTLDDQTFTYEAEIFDQKEEPKEHLNEVKFFAYLQSPRPYSRTIKAFDIVNGLPLTH